MNDFVDELEVELRAAAGRRVRLAAARVPRPSAAAVGTGLAVAVCVVVALALLQTRGAGPSVKSTAAGSVNPQIVSSFAAFRRPRTSADAVPVRLRPYPVYAQCSGPPEIPPGSSPLLKTQGQALNRQVTCFVGRTSTASVPPEQISPTVPSRLRAAAKALLRKGANLRAAERNPRSTANMVASKLQFNDSRSAALPNGLGTIWLIPSGRWLCALATSRAISNPPRNGSLDCEPIGEILAKPPLPIGGIWNGYYFAVEPDRIVRVTLIHPGVAARATSLRDHVLAACVGSGDTLLQSTSDGAPPVRTSLGGAGHRPPPICPGLP